MVERMEMAYIKAKEFYEKDNRSIFNATVGGNLEIFQRVLLGNVVSSNEKQLI